MKMKKIMISMGFVFIAFLLMMYVVPSNAATETQKFGITEYRKPDKEGKQYSYERLSKKVWKLVKYKSDGTFTYDDAIYCLKAEQGFYSETGSYLDPVEYNLSYNFKDKASMTLGLPVGEDVYNQILWVLDNSYIPAQSTKEQRDALLTAAFTYFAETTEGKLQNYHQTVEYTTLTDDDIEAVQQLVLWYYTNKEDTNYHNNGEFGPIMADLKTRAKAEVEAAFGDMPEDRQDDCTALYRYFIETSEANKSTAITDEAPITLNETLKPTIEEKTDSYVLGPYHINKNNDKVYTLEMALKDEKDQAITNYTLQKQDGTAIVSIKDTVGEDFYISVPKTVIAKSYKFSINGTYTDSTMTYWTKGGAQSTVQPLVVIEQTPKTIQGEKLVEYKQFDLSLRKFIAKIGNKETNRAPTVDTTKLDKIVAEEKVTTATYNHPKNSLNAIRGDVIVYTIRVYNEGDIDGYTNVITDQLAPELEFLPDHELNKQYEWKASADGRTLTTDYLAKTKETASRQNLISSFDGSKLQYKEVQVACKLKDTAEYKKQITNLAQISDFVDSNGVAITDRDSEKDNMVYPSDEELPKYDQTQVDSGMAYIPGQQDDDDFEKVFVAYFDLALRKFITGVNDTAVTDRIPQAKIDADGKITYEHTKEPVGVANGDVVTYTLRIYNEGLVSGYANEVVDDVPTNLEFLPDNETNKEYGWKLSEDGKQIKTEYLSKESGDTASRNNLIPAFDGKTLVYKEVKIAFKVTEPNTSDRILINTAEIADDRDENNDPVEDIDSIPGNNNEWNKEDDLDKEFVKVKYFDLALKKWVSKAIVIEDGKETVTETGHTGDENPEPIVKVDLNRKKLNKVTVKFEFQIKVTNEGEIAGYAKEVTDYVPEGLKFVAEDNKEWYVRDNDQNKVATKALENTLLQPGESATVPILLTWINSQDNMGLKVNVAEISKDYNESNTPDIDSVPDNKKDGEDDIDDAPVMLSITLGQDRMYYGIAGLILITVAGGIFIIKKYVL